MGWKGMCRMIGMILIGIFVFAWLIKAPIASRYLTNLMHVPVSMTNFSVWPSETTIRWFKIKNPIQFTYRKALEVSKIKATYQLNALLSSPRVIDQLDLVDVSLVVLFTDPLGTENNWTVIGKEMSSSSGSEDKGTMIHKVIISNLSVEVRGLMGGTKVTKYDHMEIDDVSSETGFPAGVIIRDMFKQVNLQQYIQKAFDVPEGIINDSLDSILNL